MPLAPAAPPLPTLRGTRRVLWLWLWAAACGPAPEMVDTAIWQEHAAAIGDARLPARPWSPRFAVVGGAPASERQYPATGVLLYSLRRPHARGRPLGTMLCSGSLVAPDVVLAAAHCQVRSADDVEIYFSRSADVSGLGPHAMVVPEDAVRVTSFEPHPGYRRSARTRRVGRVNDLGLFFLADAIDEVEPVRVPPPALAEALLVPGRAVDIVGYGRRSEWNYGAGDDGIKTWGASTLAEVGDFELEIGRADDDAYKCFGDSGGPTFAVDELGVAWMVGLTSRGAALTSSAAAAGGGRGACHTGGIDTRLDPYLDWLNERMQSACGTALRPQCGAVRGRVGVSGLARH